jgi:UDP:flavonoid glycosyltransferase YjiC (YdhE family)
MTHDQPDNAARMRRLGCGLELPRGRCGSRSLARALGRVLGERSFAEKARLVAARFDGLRDPFDIASEALESLGSPGTSSPVRI